MESQNNAMAAEGELIPLATRKNFDVSILYGPGSKIKVRSISELTSDLIGSLVVCRAIVVRVSEVKPEIMVATYACDICGCENYL